MIVFFSVYSYLLDQYYYKIEYGDTAVYRDSVLAYLVSFPIYSFPASIAVPVLYNFFINGEVNKSRFRFVLRFLFGLGIGLFIGYAVQRTGVSFYIGHLRTQKNLILYPAIGVSV